MPGWLQLLLAAAGGGATLVGGVVAIRKVFAAVREAWLQLIGFLQRIDDASQGFRLLSEDMRNLAGSTVQLAMAMVRRHEELAEKVDANTSRLNDLAELYTDMFAAVQRLRKGR